MKKLLSLSIYVNILVCLNGLPIDETSGLVETSNGKLQGKLLYTPNSVPFWAFLEVPYATPPVGELRFMQPLPPQNWQGIRNATENTKICWEIRKNKKVNDPRENEDCLYLNVYVPKKRKSNDALSVMVFFTGGGYNFNDGTFKSYKPYVFVEQDVISVFTNFRQGAFGFLSTGDDVITGNNGLWDQRKSLIWVQNNIAKFGGDPKKVTIMGHSSGACSINAHIQSRHSKSLFRAAIIQSGALLKAVEPNPRYMAYKFGSALSRDFSEKNSSTDLLKLLNSLPASVISNTTFDVEPKYNSSIGGLRILFKLVAGNSTDDSAFFKEPVFDNAANGNLNGVPLMIGITSEEMVMFPDSENVARIHDEDPSSLLPGSSILKEKRGNFGTEIKRLYTKVPFTQNMSALISLKSDIKFSFAVINYADVHSNYSDVYFYKYSYFGPLNLQNPKKLQGLGLAGHCAELPYIVYYHLDGDKKEYPPSDLQTRDRLGKLITNFIKHLNPTPEKDPALENVIWPMFKSGEYLYLDIDSNLTVRSHPREHYSEWWSIVKKYYKRPINIID